MGKESLSATSIVRTVGQGQLFFVKRNPSLEVYFLFCRNNLRLLDVGKRVQFFSASLSDVTDHDG